MRWTPGGVSDDIEDRRDEGGGGGGGGGFGFGGMHLGIGGTILLVVLSIVFRTNFFALFQGGEGTPSSYRSAPPRARTATPAEQRRVQFVSFVLDDAQRTWSGLLPETGASYRHAKLVLFRDGVESACGTAESATGPFYCPGDEKVYLDLGFFDELRDRFKAAGEFAEAYVIAHELGHHVQKLLGVEARVRRLQRGDPSARNPLSVKLELQADCLAGVWGHSTSQRAIIDEADVAAALRAASAIGDDRLQRMSTGHVSPETFTHGTSAQRVQWFKRGLQEGTVAACNTFQRE
ncbi:MAG: neutral zinc metallopeptidase [Acidobacteria bacterium]|nr:neutral zinc metallopeptidase [Acidobacteriota bacterium]